MHDTGHTDELQSSAIHSDPLDTPPIIESDLAESVVTGTEEPQEPHISEFPTVPL